MSLISDSTTDPRGAAMQAEITSLAAQIAALDAAVPETVKAGEVLAARKAQVESDYVQHVLGTGRLSAAEVIADCTFEA